MNGSAMTMSNRQRIKREQAGRIVVEIIRATGVHETASIDGSDWVHEAEILIGADLLDTVDLRNGRLMLVDDVGHAKNLPDNPEATALYHNICKPGTTHQIRGDVVIGKDKDFT
jgi:hypothetical protein